MKPGIYSKFSVITIFFLLFTLSGCGKISPESSPGMKNQTYSESDSGSTVNLTLNEVFEIRLAGNPSTGYTWEISEIDNSVLAQVGETTFEEGNSAPGLVGAGGIQVLTFKGVGAGTSNLTLVYHRPWETDVPPINVFSITVTVQ